MKRVLVAGMGQMGSLHYRHLKNDSRVIVDTAKDDSELRKKLPLQDGVVIALPYQNHYGTVQRAIDLDVDVFVEKPLSETYSQARELVKEAGVKKRFIAVGQIVRYFPSIRYAKELIAGSHIGKINAIECRRLSPKVIKQWWRPLQRFLLLYEGVHTIDTVLYLLGAPPDHSSGEVHCKIPELAGDTEFKVSLAWENGVRASIYNKVTSLRTREKGIRKPSYGEICITGEKGVMKISNFSNVWVNKRRLFQSKFRMNMMNGSASEMDDFVRSLITGVFFGVNATDVLPTMRIIEQIYCSEQNRIDDCAVTGADSASWKSGIYGQG